MNFDILQTWPPEIATIFLSILPITEIRASIPLAIHAYGLSVWEAIFWSILGNAVAALFLILLIEPVCKFLSEKSELLKKLFEWLFERTRRKFYNKHIKYGDIALILFVAVPLPGTGAWTGSLAAWLFGIRPKKAFTLVSAGIFLSAIIVTVLTLGIGKLIN